MALTAAPLMPFLRLLHQSRWPAQSPRVTWWTTVRRGL